MVAYCYLNLIVPGKMALEEYQDYSPYLYIT